MTYLIRRRKTAVLTYFTAALLAAAAGLITARAADDGASGYIVKYKEGAARLSEDSGVPFDVVSEEEMQRLDSEGLLEWYEPDGEMMLLDDPVTEYSEDKWDLALVRADAAFRLGGLGQNVRVGVLDSGINPHEDIAGRLISGQSYISGGSSEDTADNYGHGTHVAGLIAGSGKNGCIGAAPGAELVPLKVTDGNGIMVSTVCRAVYGAVNDYDCDILNLSLGVWSEYESLREAVEYAEEKGVVIVSAAGNNGSRAKVYPAAYDTVIGVGAVDSTGTWFYHSNYNDSVTVTAPGVNVRTVGKYGGYELKTGTSFSTAFAAAAAAVMLSIDSTLTPADIREIISQTAADKGARGYDEYYGAGILDIGGCADYLAGWRCRLLPVTGAASRILNTAGTETECAYVLAEYDENGALVRTTSHDLTIPANGTADIEMPPENTNYGQFVLSKEMVMPLAIARKSH